MTDFPDEMLMAYADNELSPRDRALLDARLSVDADLKARLQPFTATGSSLSAFFDQPLREPVPSRLIEAITSIPAPRARSVPRVLVQREEAGWLETIGNLIFPRPQFASAFGLAALLTVGGVAGWMLGRDGNVGNDVPALVALDNGELAASGALLVALETTPSRPMTAEALGHGVTPLQSFPSRDGSFCREYRAGGEGGQTFAGVACRQAGGAWRIAAQVETPRSPETPQITPKKDGYETAGGPEALNAVVEALRKGDVLGTEDEAAVMARRWAPAAKQ
jgi:hypothetical protein